MNDRNNDVGGILESSYTDIKNRGFAYVQKRLIGTAMLSDEEVKRLIEEFVYSDFDASALNRSVQIQLGHELFNRIRRLDVLSDFLEDDSVTEIMVNGTQEIFVEKKGHIVGTGKRFENKERLFDIIGTIAANVNRAINMSSPILDARLDDGSRVNAVLDPVAINGPCLTIRRFPADPVDADKLISYKSVTKEVLLFLKDLVVAGYNILISGGTGSGKTTFLNVLSGYIPRDERVITIEDSAELRIMGIHNLVRLETRNATSEGVREISIRDLIRTALRMRPDRIVVGEVRGEEAIDMLQAFNVGQDGSLSTIHANSAEDAVSRLETMVMLSTNIPLAALRRQIASGVGIIIHLGRLRDKSRRLLEIREVLGTDGSRIQTHTLYRFCENNFVGENSTSVKGKLVKEEELFHTDKLRRAGITYEL